MNAATLTNAPDDILFEIIYHLDVRDEHHLKCTAKKIQATIKNGIKNGRVSPLLEYKRSKSQTKSFFSKLLNKFDNATFFTDFNNPFFLPDIPDLQVDNLISNVPLQENDLNKFDFLEQRKKCVAKLIEKYIKEKRSTLHKILDSTENFFAQQQTNINFIFKVTHMTFQMYQINGDIEP